MTRCQEESAAKSIDAPTSTWPWSKSPKGHNRAWRSYGDKSPRPLSDQLALRSRILGFPLVYHHSLAHWCCGLCSLYRTIAIPIDATIIRLLLVHPTIRIMGK
jgi:hypothetical protein